MVSPDNQTDVRPRRTPDVWDLSEAAVTAAAARTRFDLSYERAEMPRRFHASGITGGDIADAFGNPGERAPGEWENGGRLIRHLERDPVVTEAEAFESFFTDAISEAVHEALEWFRIDGACALDPHGKHEDRIYELTGALAAELWALRTGATS